VSHQGFAVVTARAESLRQAARVGRIARRVGASLDRVDDVVLPAVTRVVGDRLGRAGATSVAAIRIARRAAASVTAPAPASSSAGDSTEPLPRGRAALRRDGPLARAAHLGMVAAVGVIAVSTAAATLQGQDRFTTTPRPSPPLTGTEVAGGADLESERQHSRDGSAPPEAYALGLPGGAETGGGQAPTETITVGPYPNDDVTAYLAYARSRLDAMTSAAPEADLFAVVSFTSYRTPRQLLELLATYRIHRVFLRLPPDGEQVEAEVRDPVADVDEAFARAADAAARRAEATAEPAARERAGREAAALGGRCACLFSAVVRASAGRLAEFAQAEGVRIVDVAPPGSTLAGSTFVPLLPERR
jgi:hypothetical protein